VPLVQLRALLEEMVEACSDVSAEHAAPVLWYPDDVVAEAVTRMCTGPVPAPPGVTTGRGNDPSMPTPPPARQSWSDCLAPRFTTGLKAGAISVGCMPVPAASPVRNRAGLRGLDPSV
jgi:hypothetical protein